MTRAAATTNCRTQPASCKRCHNSRCRAADGALRAEQLDVLAFSEAAALEVLDQSPRDGAQVGASREVELDDDDDVDAGVHARDAERALPLAELPVGPLHHLGGRGDEVGAARDGLIAEEWSHGGAPEQAAEGANHGAESDGLGVGAR